MRPTRSSGRASIGRLTRSERNVCPVVISRLVQVPGRSRQGRTGRHRPARDSCPGTSGRSRRGCVSLGLLADDGVGVEPEQRPLEVEVLAAPQLVPVRAAGAEQMGGHRGVLERAPFPAGPEHQPADRGGERLAIVLRAHQAAADHEQLAQVFGQPLVDPEQPGFLRRVEVRACTGRRAGGYLPHQEWTYS